MLQTLFSRIVEILEKDEYDGMVRQFLVDDKVSLTLLLI